MFSNKIFENFKQATEEDIRSLKTYIDSLEKRIRILENINSIETQKFEPFKFSSKLEGV